MCVFTLHQIFDLLAEEATVYDGQSYVQQWSVIHMEWFQIYILKLFHLGF